MQPGAADIEVVVAGVQSPAVLRHTDRRPIVKQRRFTESAPVDGARQNPRVTRKQVRSVGEIEAVVFTLAIGQPVESNARAKLQRLTLSEPPRDVEVAGP